MIFTMSPMVGQIPLHALDTIISQEVSVIGTTRGSTMVENIELPWYVVAKGRIRPICTWVDHAYRYCKLQNFRDTKIFELAPMYIFAIRDFLERPGTSTKASRMMCSPIWTYSQECRQWSVTDHILWCPYTNYIFLSVPLIYSLFYLNYAIRNLKNFNHFFIHVLYLQKSALFSLVLTFHETLSCIFFCRIDIKDYGHCRHFWRDKGFGMDFKQPHTPKNILSIKKVRNAI